ncbi:GNAT family N-acetyltransferase [Sphingomonas sp. CROZ-RG-20F-R02-07]|uniref:GNAT family N-acetyltransferase n=1 Tax=Sphingomonas sp. CROZ-RG-20F-R02-07 TaxID=2914832 RepID=UPI001F5824CB|nr:GNAT family N-acetyltransferase [Sphingomonas sp. CROZ-RG-20F-R02-07]
MTRIDICPYVESDRAAALAIFDSNLPEYFGPGEREWFGDSLDELDGPAFVVTVDGTPAAFGGYEIWDYYDKALLCWGMAARAHHKSGLGRLLLFERLLRIAREDSPRTRYVTVDTSPLVSPFFQHCGFELSSVWPGGYRSGLDMHELRYDLSATTEAALVAARDAAWARAESRLAP